MFACISTNMPTAPRSLINPIYHANGTCKPQDGWLDAGVTGEGEVAAVDAHPPKYVLFAHHLDVLDRVQEAVQKAFRA